MVKILKHTESKIEKWIMNSFGFQTFTKAIYEIKALKLIGLKYICFQEMILKLI